MSASLARIDVPLSRFGGVTSGALGELLYRRPARSNQTIKARNPAKKNPPSSIDQSPVSKPRSRPPVVKRSAAERNIVDAFMPFDHFQYKHAKCLLAVARRQHQVTTVIKVHHVSSAISMTW
jgi:hypothetical protein